MLSLGLLGIYLFFKSFWLLGAGFPTVIYTIGSGLGLMGFCLLSFLGAKVAILGLIQLTRWIFVQIKSLFIKKGGELNEKEYQDHLDDFHLPDFCGYRSFCHRPVSPVLRPVISSSMGFGMHPFVTETTSIMTLKENNTYHVSDASINSIDIDWISGRVTVIPLRRRRHRHQRKSKGKIDEENCLRYRISGDTLEINYFRQTAGEFNFTGSINYSKQLEIKVPRALAKKPG